MNCFCFYPKPCDSPKKTRKGEAQGPLQRDGCQMDKPRRTFLVVQRTNVWGARGQPQGNKWQPSGLGMPQPQRSGGDMSCHPRNPCRKGGLALLDEGRGLSQPWLSKSMWWWALSLRWPSSLWGPRAPSKLGICSKDNRLSLVDQIYSDDKYAREFGSNATLKRTVLP